MLNERLIIETLAGDVHSLKSNYNYWLLFHILLVIPRPLSTDLAVHQLADKTSQLAGERESFQGNYSL